MQQANRIYMCEACGHKEVIKTNHTLPCYPICKGKCKTILTGRNSETVTRKQTKHVYVSEA